MEPPPASLEALVRRRPASSTTPERSSRWLWIGLLMVTIGVVMYYAGLRR
jgi:hypothetical protein